MMGKRAGFLAILSVLWLALVSPALAVLPSEVLDDPALEARARDISAGLRCMVCQNQSIDDSNAELARDLRVLVRERLVAGDTNAQVVDYVVSRYGEFVLLKPRLNVRNALLWATPALLLAIGGGFILLRARQGRRAPTRALSAAEDARLREILKDAD